MLLALLAGWLAVLSPCLLQLNGVLHGTVKLTSTAATWGVIATPNALGRCRGAPRNERTRAQKSLMAGAKPMSSNGEQVTNGVVDREEPLGVCHRFEAPHVALALAGRLV